MTSSEMIVITNSIHTNRSFNLESVTTALVFQMVLYQLQSVNDDQSWKLGELGKLNDVKTPVSWIKKQ